MPVGFLITAGLVTLGMAVSLWPPARSGPFGLVTWLISAIPNESPFLAFYWMGISTWLAFSNFHGPQVWIAVGLATAARGRGRAPARSRAPRADSGERARACR